MWLSIWKVCSQIWCRMLYTSEFISMFHYVKISHYFFILITLLFGYQYLDFSFHPQYFCFVFLLILLGFHPCCGVLLVSCDSSSRRYARSRHSRSRSRSRSRSADLSGPRRCFRRGNYWCSGISFFYLNEKP